MWFCNLLSHLWKSCWPFHLSDFWSLFIEGSLAAFLIYGSLVASLLNEGLGKTSHTTNLSFDHHSLTIPPLRRCQDPPYPNPRPASRFGCVRTKLLKYLILFILPGLAQFTLLVITLLYISFGAAGYLSYGPNTQGGLHFNKQFFDFKIWKFGGMPTISDNYMLVTSKTERTGKYATCIQYGTIYFQFL